MRPYAPLLLALFSLLAFVAPVQGQPDHTDGRITISANGGFHASNISFASAQTALVYQEAAQLNASYTVTPGPFFDVGVAIRPWRQIGVGVVVSSFSRQDPAPISASIPHPFLYNTPRTLTGTANDLSRSEVAAHIQAAYLIRAGDKVTVVLAGGPSFFSLTQDVVTDVAYGDVYPFDTVTFTSATTTSLSRTAVGFNVSGDLTFKLSRHLGVGAVVRFARASADLPASPNAVHTDLGGPQVGAGLRMVF